MSGFVVRKSCEEDIEMSVPVPYQCPGCREHMMSDMTRLGFPDMMPPMVHCRLNANVITYIHSWKGVENMCKSG